jgi:hypothetical protein
MFLCEGRLLFLLGSYLRVKLGEVTHGYNPSYLGRGDLEYHPSIAACKGKSSQDPPSQSIKIS